MDILEDRKLRDDAMKELYEASLNGCVSTLNTLIQKDPLILTRVSLYPFTETPLHIASLLGHFCEVVLRNSPNLATEVDSEGRCPLHFASSKGHTEVVKALLRTNPEVCFVRDKDEMLPLHFAVMRGRVGAIKEFMKAKPDSILEMIKTDDGSVLHLCVRYNHLEDLKLLLESLRSDQQSLSLKDKEDNTFLRLALKRRQIKIIKYLLSLSEMITEINSLNSESLTAIMDTLERCPRNFMNQQRILTEGVEKPANEVIAHEAVSSATLDINQQNTLSTFRRQPTFSQNITVVIVQSEPPEASSSSSIANNDPPQTSSSSSITNNDPPQTSLSSSITNNDPPQTSSSSSLQQTLESNGNAPPEQPTSSSQTQSMTNELVQQEPPQDSTQPQAVTVTPGNITNEQKGEDIKWKRLERFCRRYLLDQGNWIDKRTREQLMVAATVIATMTFQSVISPPGGVWQGDTTQDGFTCSEYGFCEAGTAVVGYAWSPDFLKFVFFNSASFFSSLCVMLVLMSGLPLENKIVMWVLAVLMIVAASCMLLTYMWALGLVSPNHIYYRIRKLGYLLVGIWAVLLAFVALIQTSRIVFWVRSRLRPNRNPSTNATS